MRHWLLLLLTLMVAEAFFLAPPDLPSTMPMVWRICTFDWVGIAPGIIGLFYAVGFVLLLHFSFLMSASRQARPHPLYVAVPALFLGSFVLLPYLALRRHGPPHPDRRIWPGWVVVRVTAVAGLLSCGLYGLLAGDSGMLWYELTTRQFSHVMAIDFVVLVGLLPLVADEIH